MNMTDEQWTVLEPLIGELPKRADEHGRPAQQPLSCGVVDRPNIEDMLQVGKG